MPLSSERKYDVDGQRLTAHELIAEAANMDREFANRFIKSTSRAAAILREFRIEVSEVDAV